MGWGQAAGTPPTAEEIEADVKKSHEREIQAAHDRQKVLDDIAERRAKESVEGLAAKMKERGIVQGDLIPVVLEGGVIVEGMVDLRQIPGMPNCLRMVASEKGVRTVTDEVVKRALTGE